MALFQEHRRVLEKAYHDTRSPLAIAEECLLQREKRQGIDQVHDDVERSLSKVLAYFSLLKNSSTSNWEKKIHNSNFVCNFTGCEFVCSLRILCCLRRVFLRWYKSICICALLKYLSIIILSGLFETKDISKPFLKIYPWDLPFSLKSINILHLPLSLAENFIYSHLFISIP